MMEDDGVVRELAAEMLRELGYDVLEAEDGTAALRVLWSAARVDLMVTDVGLPGLNGRQVADAARERRPGLPVLFITGYAGAALAGWQLAPGMAVLGKPFVLDALAERVRARASARWMTQGLAAGSSTLGCARGTSRCCRFPKPGPRRSAWR